jgi:hypothetical protein
MAQGIGLPLVEVLGVEDGTATEALMNHYVTWLDRLERWPANRRSSALLAASDGRMFPA